MLHRRGIEWWLVKNTWESGQGRESNYIAEWTIESPILYSRLLSYIDTYNDHHPCLCGMLLDCFGWGKQSGSWPRFGANNKCQVCSHPEMTIIATLWMTARQIFCFFFMYEVPLKLNKIGARALWHTSCKNKIWIQFWY